MDKQLEVKNNRDDTPVRLSSGPIDKAFLTDLLIVGKETKFYEKILEYSKGLETHVSKLDSHIDSVLQRHEQDFLNAFKCQMFSLYGQLKELKKKNDENEIKLKRDEQINKLQKSLEWFREEAIKNGESTAMFKKEADKWKAKAESLQDDRNFLETQLKNAKRKMKLMMIERKADSESDDSIKTSPRESVELQATNFVSSSKTGEIIQEIREKHPDQASFLYQLEHFFHELEIKYNESIKHLKNTLENERKKFKLFSAQQSSMFFVKSDLETLFLDCVEEVRKEISRRKIKNTVEQKYSKRAKTSNPISRETMTPSDKRKILELLISNEQVLIMLYEKLFPHRASQYGNNTRTGEKTEEESPPNLEEMLKQVPTKPILPKTMSFQHRGRSVV